MESGFVGLKRADKADYFFYVVLSVYHAKILVKTFSKINKVFITTENF